MFDKARDDADKTRRDAGGKRHNDVVAGLSALRSVRREQQHRIGQGPSLCIGSLSRLFREQRAEARIDAEGAPKDVEEIYNFLSGTNMDKPTAIKMATELKGKNIAGWTVGDLLGSGGSAVVLDAQRDNQKSALKIIDPALEKKFGAEKQEARIAYEMRLVGRQHPNLVKIYDGGRCTHTNYLFIAMEYLPYKNLDEIEKPFPAAKIAPIMEQIAQASRFLEELGICHRDIKPENICITPDFNQAILLDLGILRPLDDQNKLDAGTGSNFIGTYRYSPPEFVRRQEEETIEGFRALTFYQLGAVLHDLIMNVRMFDAIDGPLAALIDCVTNTVPTIENTSIDQRIVYLARDCLQKDWHTRLRLVNWDSFLLPHQMKQDAKERVRAVINCVNKPSDVVLQQNNYSRRAIENATRLARDQARSIVLSNPDFPRAAIDFKVEDDSGIFWVEFEESPRHQLAPNARLSCRLAPVGTSWILEVYGSWGEPEDNCTWQRLTTWRQQGDDITVELEQALYSLVSGGMNLPCPKIGSVIPLV